MSDLAACAKAFPGMKATFEEVLKWRKHPGYEKKFDPFINPQLPAEAADKAFTPVRTPEFELSRKLDETMRGVYKNLYDALTDKTLSRQKIKLDQAYSAITEFHKEHADLLSQMQTASIACTRDQVAKLQGDLAQKKGKLNVSVEQLEASFQRMNSWRTQDDPLKTMSLSQYIDKDQREAHAGAVAEEDSLRIHVDATEMIADIEAISRDRGGFGGKGLWFGINNNVLCQSGQRLPKGTLITCKNEEEWTRLLKTLPMMNCKCELLTVPGTESYVSELTDVRHDGKLLTVIYWGIAIEDSDGEGSGDPRANLVCNTLSGWSFVWPYVSIWAQIQQVDRTESDDDRKAEDVKPHNHSPTTGDDDDAESVNSAARWSAPISCPSAASTLRHESNKLMERAQAVANLGDHKTAYELMAKSYNLCQQADGAKHTSESVCASPADEEPTVYKPDAKYEYPSGEVRTIDAGYYTESEHLKRSVYEQDLLTAVKTATAPHMDQAVSAPVQALLARPREVRLRQDDLGLTIAAREQMQMMWGCSDA